MAGPSKSHLSVAPADARVERFEPKNISEALEGSSRDVWIAMRKGLAKMIDDGALASNAISSAYKELRELDRLIRLAEQDAARDGAVSGDVNVNFDASAI